MDEIEEPDYSLYVEKSTRYIYEAQLFDTFVLYRPATPEYRDALVKVSLSEFADQFEEYQGDWQNFYDLLRYGGAVLIVN